MNGKILIVDDSPADILLLTKLMKDSSFEFDSVSSIAECEKYLSENTPRAIILDYMLEDGESMCVVEKFQSSYPIILLTGMEDPEIGLTAVKSGAQDFLTKGHINKDLLHKSLQYSMERQTLKSRVSNAEKMATLGRMSSGIAHEMNTPIQYVSDNLYFLEKEFNGILAKMKAVTSVVQSAEDSTLKESLKNIYEDIDFQFLDDEIPDAVKQSLEGMEKISKLVKALKNYAANEETSQTKKVDINDVLDHIIAQYSSKNSEILDFHFHPDLEIKPILAEERNLHQIFENIVINAVFELKSKFKGTGGKGYIKITTSQNEHAAEIRISDNGKGIPEDIIDHIFDPFYTTKSFSGNLGQGLAIVHRLIYEVLEGSIKVSSDPASGTEFIVSIPLQNII